MHWDSPAFQHNPVEYDIRPLGSRDHLLFHLFNWPTHRMWRWIPGAIIYVQSNTCTGNYHATYSILLEMYNEHDIVFHISHPSSTGINTEMYKVGLEKKQHYRQKDYQPLTYWHCGRKPFISAHIPPALMETYKYHPIVCRLSSPIGISFLLYPSLPYYKSLLWDERLVQYLKKKQLFRNWEKQIFRLTNKNCVWLLRLEIVKLHQHKDNKQKVPKEIKNTEVIVWSYWRLSCM